MDLAAATRRLARATGLVGLLVASQAQAVPHLMQVRGKLVSSTGLPSSASKDMTISLYDAGSGGSALWTSAVQTVSVASDGGFNFLVDATTGSPSLILAIATTATSGGAWFEFTVDAGTANGIMNTPQVVAGRSRATGQAFALATASADSLRTYPVATPAPTTTNQLLKWSSGAWTASDPPGKQWGLNTESFRRTTTSLNLYVRTDGNDSTCTGLANASSASAPACALATPQKAVDVVPEMVLHSVTINVQAGTYRAATAGATLLAIAKNIQPDVNFVVVGSGAVVFSGATSGAPTTSVGSYGIEVRAPSNGLRLSNLTTNYFTRSGLVMHPATGVTLTGITSSNNASYGLQARPRSSVTLVGSSAFNSNSASGIVVRDAWLQVNSGTLSSVSNAGYGIQAEAGLIEMLTGVTANISNNSYGIYSQRRASTVSGAVMILNSNTGSGVYNRNATSIFTAALTANSNGYIGVEGSGNSSIQMDGNVVINSNGLTGASAYSLGQLYFNKGLSSTMTTAGWYDSIIADQHGAIYLNNSGSDAITLTGNASNVHRAMRSTGNSLIVKSGSGSVTLSNYLYQGIWLHSRGVFIDIGSGSRSVTGITYSDTAYVDQMSLYRRGNFAAGNCAAGTLSRCN